MSKRILSMLLAVIILCTSCLTACKSGKNGDFYPYKLSKYVSLGNYKAVSYEPLEVSVTDKDVDNEIYSQMKSFGLTTTQEKTSAIKTGDTAIINYVGYIDGKAFEGGSAQNTSLEIGSGRFIDGFESGLIGKKAGEKVSLDLKFPDGYHNSDFAGKAVRFEVEITKVYETIYPEITYSVVSKMSSYLTVREYREDIYNTLLKKKTEEIENQNKNNLISSIIACCDIKKYPKAEVEQYKSDLIKNYEMSASNDNLTLETLVAYNGLTMAQFEEQMEKSAKNLVAKEMVFLMIADEEGLEISSEEYEENLAIQMEANKITSKQTFLEVVGEDTFMGLLLIDKTIDHMETMLTEDKK